MAVAVEMAGALATVVKGVEVMALVATGGVEALATVAVTVVAAI